MSDSENQSHSERGGMSAPGLKEEPLALLVVVALVTLGALIAVYGLTAVFLTSWMPWTEFDDEPVETARLVLLIVAGVGGVVALVVAYRRQRHLEKVERPAIRQRLHDEQTRLFTERFGHASGQLGHPQAAVRLAGVYALASLADAWKEQQQQCIDVLCAYLRLPTPQASPTIDADHAQEADGQVRTTIIKVIKDHLPRDPGTSPTTTWTSRTFNFRGAALPPTDLRGIYATGKFDFGYATFTMGANFRGARLTGGADFGGVSFLMIAVFGDARFAELADFWGARFAELADFGGARFTGDTDFGGATFTGNANFKNARFVELADFEDARFAGDANFKDARFARDANFKDATFTLSGDFEDARFARDANFKNATFTGFADFGGARFTGDTAFGGVTLALFANYESARALAEHVDLTSARIATAASSEGILLIDGSGNEQRVTGKLPKVRVLPLA